MSPHGWFSEVWCWLQSTLLRSPWGPQVHVCVAWDIDATDERWTKIDDQLKGVIRGYSWVRPLKTVYIVKIKSLEQRTALLKSLQVIAKANSEVNLIVTPAMSGGQYNGWLPGDLWPKIRQRTAEDA